MNFLYVISYFFYMFCSIIMPLLYFTCFCLGPIKLFVLIKAPSSFNQPMHFLPKRDFRYNRKVK